jgi:hypothetical protein
MLKKQKNMKIFFSIYTLLLFTVVFAQTDTKTKTIIKTDSLDLINNGWGYNWSMSNGDAEDNMTQFIADFNQAVSNGLISIIP